MSRRRSEAGFTLIELLIVVAIIAILAAIAVPNFLEAQVRGKVARVKADMRTMATALTSYTVDNRKPPPGMSFYGHWHPEQDLYDCLNALTTPIAYLTSSPHDPFSLSDDPPAYQCFMDMGIGSGYDVTLYPVLRGKGYQWVIHSYGPDGATEERWADWQLAFPDRRYASGLTGWDQIYDPTNGTRSKGDIGYTNKGMITGYTLQP